MRRNFNSTDVLRELRETTNESESDTLRDEENQAVQKQFGSVEDQLQAK